MNPANPRFGTDGVRGVANVELTPQLALDLGSAAARVFGSKHRRPHVVVGRDTRISGDFLEAALAAGFASMGCDVTCLGVVPTPAVSFAAVTAHADAGAVISASHNPFCDNGIKLFGANGGKLSDDDEEQIERMLESSNEADRPAGADVGRIIRSRDLVPRYVDRVVSSAPARLDGIGLVLDCANGACSEIAPVAFRALGAKVTVIHSDPDGVNINTRCGSTHPECLCAKVREIGADAGLAFDGDGDRVIFSDETGSVVDGDHMMAICAFALQERGLLSGDAVVSTIMSNAGLEMALDSRGIRLHRTAVGDKYVAAEMARCGAALGGEQSGHLLFPHLSATGDGMVTGLQVLGATLARGMRLSEAAGIVTTCPQILRNVRLRDRGAWQETPEIAAAIEGARNRVGRPEWLSVRPSGTEPVVRVMAQDPDNALVEAIVSELCGLISARFGMQ